MLLEVFCAREGGRAGRARFRELDCIAQGLVRAILPSIRDLLLLGLHGHLVLRGVLALAHLVLLSLAVALVVLF